MLGGVMLRPKWHQNALTLGSCHSKAAPKTAGKAGHLNAQRAGAGQAQLHIQCEQAS